ncbi:MAG: hypothetical protein P4L69_05280 [Desulfosporosinus sp.]|nr:hypothetical protein [Desulfosporosinus sp.]
MEDLMDIMNSMDIMDIQCIMGIPHIMDIMDILNIIIIGIIILNRYMYNRLIGGDGIQVGKNSSQLSTSALSGAGVLFIQLSRCFKQI